MSGGTAAHFNYGRDTLPNMASKITDARQIIAFRNILVHGYDIVRNEVGWGILESDLPALCRDLDALLKLGDAEETRGDPGINLTDPVG
jgi:uncharacterized protein with HEPN domain